MSAFTNALANVRGPVVRLAARPIGYLRSEWERLAPRERRLVTWLAGAVVVLGVTLFSWVKLSDISQLEEDNAKIREALSEIGKHHDEYLEAKTRNAVQEQRIGNEPPQLVRDLEEAARGENVQIAESSERPAAPAGRRYVQHDLDVRLREVDLQSLTKFMRRVETGPRLIMFTRVSLKHRYSETDKLDAELTATAFEKVKEDKKKKTDGQKPGSAAGKKE
jgi:type II secretory pathway component PulM